MVVVEIDQSGRIEETHRDTIIAAASKNWQFTLRIRRSDKRLLQKCFRRQGRPKMFAITTFAYAVAYLINISKVELSGIVIDIEYPGHEKTIKEILHSEIKQPVQIRFQSIGKSSPAHTSAYFTYKNKLKENTTVPFGELLKALKYKKHPV